jgi:hypothetical protein
MVPGECESNSIVDFVLKVFGSPRRANSGNVCDWVGAVGLLDKVGFLVQRIDCELGKHLVTTRRFWLFILFRTTPRHSILEDRGVQGINKRQQNLRSSTKKEEMYSLATPLKCSVFWIRKIQRL